MATYKPHVPPTVPPGSIDFEITDIGEARRALDELPAGIAEVLHLQPGFWEQQRRRPAPTDRALTGVALDWVMELRPHLRPHVTCELFPRVINAIAESWTDVVYCLGVLEHLISDYRGSRRGFPAAVQQELIALHEHQAARSGYR